MNIYEISQKFKITVGKVRKMHKAGVILIDDTEDPLADEIRFNLAKGQPLTTAHLLALIENPRLAWQLGNYAKRAQAQVAALGDLTNGVAPHAVAAEIYSSAGGDPDSLDRLIAWLKEIIPARPVDHHYSAVRLALGLPTHRRAEFTRRIPRALYQCRKRQEFAAWWRPEKVGSRNRSLYQRPENLYDL